jgi:hypothetical protein
MIKKYIKASKILIILMQRFIFLIVYAYLIIKEIKLNLILN